MTSETDRPLQLLEEIRDLLQEEVRLRQTMLDDNRQVVEEQRLYQAQVQKNVVQAGRSQRLTVIVVAVVVVLWLASSFLLPLIFGLRSMLDSRNNDGRATVRSQIDTALFDGDYELIADRSFQQTRQRLAEESDPLRRQRGERLLVMMSERLRPFFIRHGVIRSGSRPTQEISLQTATIDGKTLTGQAIWHEDANDPGDSSEEPVRLHLEGDVLEFVLGSMGTDAPDAVFLKRVVPTASK